MRKDRGHADGGSRDAELDAKRAREKRTLALMIGIYCRGNGHEGRAESGPGPHGAGLCPECRELVGYCLSRIDSCPHVEEKTFCSACETHCYRPDMREHVRAAMAYAGPRMIFHDPVGAISHLLHGRPPKKRWHAADSRHGVDSSG